MENNKEVLLSISNLKQYFPLKKGRFVKANDGVSLDIYRGETFGLVGESGCGKSTLGRTILQLYHQTYGRTMYYGKSLDDIAPKYVEQTIKNLVKLRNEWKNLEQKKAKIEEEYAALSETEQYAKHAELDQARKLAEDAMLNITKIFGGFVVVENVNEIVSAYSKEYGFAKQKSVLIEKLGKAQLKLSDLEFDENKKPGSVDSGKLASAKAKVDAINSEIEKIQNQIDETKKAIDVLREQYKNEPDFEKYEAMRDDGIDLARLE